MSISARKRRLPLSLERLAKMYDTIDGLVQDSTHQASRMAALAQCELSDIIAIAEALGFANGDNEDDPTFTGAQAATIIRKLDRNGPQR